MFNKSEKITNEFNILINKKDVDNQYSDWLENLKTSYKYVRKNIYDFITTKIYFCDYLKYIISKKNAKFSGNIDSYKEFEKTV